MTSPGTYPAPNPTSGVFDIVRADRRKAVIALWKAAAIVAGTSLVCVGGALSLGEILPIDPALVVLLGTIAVVPVFYFGPRRRVVAIDRRLADRAEAEAEVRRALASDKEQEVVAAIDSLERRGRKEELVRELNLTCLPKLERAALRLRKAAAAERLRGETINLERIVCARLQAKVDDAPANRALRQLDDVLARLERRKRLLRMQWEGAYKQFSWWDKMRLGSVHPAIPKLEQDREDLEGMRRRLCRKHGAELERLRTFVGRAQRTARARLQVAHGAATHHASLDDDRSLPCGLQTAFWLSALSVPVSVWGDVARSADIHQVLRGVNERYVGMSDTEIWLETLVLPAESLAGLVSLTKGAYLEHLVASDTGGTLHEHFNHPDTDIVIDGTAYQIKATDSAAYVDSVEDGVPVIATTEVADISDAIDSGYTDAELSESVELALGGSVTDVGDTGVDALLVGVGGIGLFATLAGLGHAATRYENGGDAVEAALEGAGVALERTARGVVGTAELGYKAVTSRPARALGRGACRGGAWVLGKL